VARRCLPALGQPDLAETGYAAVLAGLPEELRRAYRDGDFGAGLKDHECQLIPSYEDKDGRWHTEVAAGDDRPQTDVEG
jgi:hypothetical protein